MKFFAQIFVLGGGRRYGRIGGRRVRVKTKDFIKPLALGGSKGFEFARGGEGEGRELEDRGDVGTHVPFYVL